MFILEERPKVGCLKGLFLSFHRVVTFYMIPFTSFRCGNVNWARRTACNICNAPKLGDLEVRTGKQSSSI